MAGVSIKWQDIEVLNRFGNSLRALGDEKLKIVAARAINRTGDMARTQVVRALTRQTGLKRKVIVRAVKVKRAAQKGGMADLEYVMTARGGDISLKHFDARETRRGVTAKPFGARKLFEGHFMKGGRFPNRVVVPRFAGHVFQRDGAGRLPIGKVKSGVVIPAEMVQGATLEAFQKSVAANLPRRVEHELSRILAGAR